MEFDKKVIIITGASSGIGKACAVNFAKSGAFLSLVGRNVDNLKETGHLCEQYSGVQPLIINADLSIPEDVEKVVDETIERFNQIDVLVNNAGFFQKAGIMDDISNFDKMMSTNIRGTFLLTQKSIPHLIKSKGNVVIVSSIVSIIAVPPMAQYGMTKAALDTFTKCLALELGPKGVRINSVNPGPVWTDLFVKGGWTDGFFKKTFEDLTTTTPLRKLSQAEDIANLVAFLASARAQCITGCFHIIDGGLHLGEQLVY